MLFEEMFKLAKFLSPPNEEGRFFKGVEYKVNYFKVRILLNDFGKL